MWPTSPEAYRLVIDLGGWPEPHQGLASIAVAERWPDGYRSTMRALKQALDPNRTLNPGVWGL
jgi:FAD/FMN-containing dehydrogenase